MIDDTKQAAIGLPCRSAACAFALMLVVATCNSPPAAHADYITVSPARSDGRTKVFALSRSVSADRILVFAGSSNMSPAAFRLERSKIIFDEAIPEGIDIRVFEVPR